MRLLPSYSESETGSRVHPPLNILPLYSASLDVKWLSNSLQQVASIIQAKHGKLIRRLSRSNWTRPYMVALASSRRTLATSFSQEFLTQIERDSTTLIDTAADQREQVGCVQGADRLFEERLLLRNINHMTGGHGLEAWRPAAQLKMASLVWPACRQIKLSVAETLHYQLALWSVVLT